MLYAAAVLAGLSAAWSLWMFAFSLDQFAIVPYASGYGPARLTIVSVLDDPQGPFVEGTIEGSHEAIRVADLGIAVAPGTLTPGRTLDVLYNPDAPRLSLNHRELRVRAYERDFAHGQRERAARLALIAYGPVGVFLLATIACGRALRRPLRGPLTAPILLVGFQVTLAALFAAFVMIDTMQSRGWSAPAWFDDLMRASGRPGVGPALFAALVASSLLVRAWLRRRRQRGLARSAAALGLSFAPSADRPPVLPAFELFLSRGQFENWVRGDYAGLPLCVVDYSYSTGSRYGGSEQTLARFGSGAWHGPPLKLEPRPATSSASRSAPAAVPEVALPEGTPFTSAYRVCAAEADASAAREVFSSLVTDYFAGKPGWTVETRDGEMLIYRRGELVPPKEVPAFLARADEVRQALRNWA
jgi:hypothetical protein